MKALETSNLIITSGSERSECAIHGGKNLGTVGRRHPWRLDVFRKVLNYCSAYYKAVREEVQKNIFETIIEFDNYLGVTGVT